ncbi:MAG: hypothetical protein KDJ37_01540 [Hyphomicrobiaceae bacterium]|nr:hypothetical protein [Hyphomicrobiaceae bacterium]
MSDEVWDRHANPWSVWTRVVSLPPLLAAIWSHTSLGWLSLVPLAAVAGWLWLNPRLFPPPASTKSWASRATLGERVWLNRHRIAIPDHHQRVAAILAAAAGAGFVVAVAGAILNDLLLTLLGGVVSWFAKMWFCDRMVWLYDDMKDQEPAYRRWSR